MSAPGLVLVPGDHHDDGEGEDDGEVGAVVDGPGDGGGLVSDIPGDWYITSEAWIQREKARILNSLGHAKISHSQCV